MSDNDNTSGHKASFIGIGAQKCGTTWVHHCLSQHTGIYAAQGQDKDTKFFGSFYDRGYQWYESHFAEASPGLKRGEVSTSYFYNSDIPERIRRYNPDVKLFVCLRDPIERIISNHKHQVRGRQIWGDNFSLKHALDNNPAYIMQSRYALHLERWYKVFPKEQIKIVFFEDIYSAPQQLISELYEFLEVDASFIPQELDTVANASYLPAAGGTTKIVATAGRALRSIGLGTIVEQGRKMGINQWLRRSKAPANKETLTVEAEALEQICSLLQPDVDRLSELTGRDLSHWLKK